MIPVNPILAIDAYKFGHMVMHPHEISGIYGNFTPRRMEYINRLIPEQFRDNKLVSFGEEMAIKDITDSFKNNFFNRPLDQVIDEYMSFAGPFIGENKEAAAVLRKNITDLHNLGYLPLVIKALPQGTITNPQVPTITSRETVPGFGWLPQYLETYTSQSTWKTSTVATIARAYRRIYEHYADLTCDNRSHIIFQGHDFSARGMSSTEDSIKSGIAHLTQFWGSDSVHAAYSAVTHYGYKNELPLAYSVPATEHSVMCLGIALSSEEETFRRLLTQYNTGIISIVSDTEDYWNTISNISANLKDLILSRQPDSMGLCKTVFRPDSGNPVDIICGITKYYKSKVNIPDTPEWRDSEWEDELVIAISLKHDYISTPEGTIYKINSKDSVTNLTLNETKGSLQILWEIFGGTINSKGYKVLNPKVGLIYGDSITPQRANDILAKMAELGFASSNIVFGHGSFAYNYNTRDSLGYAFKATAGIKYDGTIIPIQKTVKTDTSKKSACGLLHVTENLTLIDNCTPEQEATGALQVIFKDGEMFFDTDFAAIRARASL